MNIKKLEVVFFKTANNTEPVKVWLQSLTKVDKKIIGTHIKTAQFGWPMGMPLVDSHCMVLVSGFIKKSQKTLKAELELGRKRMKQYEKSGV